MRVLKCLLFLSIIYSGTAVSNQNPDVISDDESTEFCVTLWEIDNIKIIDDQNIAFRKKNGDYYLNHLPHACPNLDEDSAIMYRTPMNRLCSLDIITVLEYIGGGFQNMGSCGLGKFKPVTKEELQFMKDAQE